MTRFAATALALFAMAACSDTMGPTGVLEPAFAKGGQGGGGGGGGGKVTYVASASGDLAMDPGPMASRSASDPFGKQDLTFNNVAVTFSGPSGDHGEEGSVCDARYPGIAGGGNFSPAWPDHTMDAGGWTGTLTVKGGTHTVNFLGTLVADGTTQFQSTIDGTYAKKQQENGVWQLVIENSAQFSDTRTTHYDGKYRCVNVTITLTPAS
jgi:hypothetical protein